MTKTDADMLPSLDEHEQERIMRDWSVELWEDALEQGFDPTLMARLLIETALQELARNNGTGETERVLSEICRLSEHGALYSTSTIQ